MDVILNQTITGRLCHKCGEKDWRQYPYCDACWDIRNEEMYRSWLIQQAQSKPAAAPLVSQHLSTQELEKLAGVFA